MPESSDRSAAARIAALTRVAQVGGSAVSAPARAARFQRFIDAVDPDRALPEGERAKRAHALMRAEMVRLASRSAAARKARGKAADAATAAAELRALADEIESTDGAA